MITTFIVWGCMAVNWINKFAAFGIVTVSSLAIASSASARFVVFVSGNDAATLQRVRTISPNAFVTNINNQPAVQAGIFNSEISADSLAISLQQAGLTAQKTFRTDNYNIQPITEVTQAPSNLIVPQTNFISPPSAIATANYSVNPFPSAFPNAFPSAVQAPTNNALLPQASQSVDFRYIAAVPASINNQFLLSRVRQFVPSAFFTNSGRGTYIHAGAYASRDAAESVSRYLRSQGLDSRVLYF